MREGGSGKGGHVGTWYEMQEMYDADGKREEEQEKQAEEKEKKRKAAAEKKAEKKGKEGSGTAAGAATGGAAGGAAGRGSFWSRLLELLRSWWRWLVQKLRGTAKAPPKGGSKGKGGGKSKTAKADRAAEKQLASGENQP